MITLSSSRQPFVIMPKTNNQINMNDPKSRETKPVTGQNESINDEKWISRKPVPDLRREAGVQKVLASLAGKRILW